MILIYPKGFGKLWLLFVPRDNLGESFHPPKMLLLVFWEKVWLIVLLWGTEEKKNPLVVCWWYRNTCWLLGGVLALIVCEMCFCLVLTSGRQLFGLDVCACSLHDKRGLTLISVLMVCVEFFKEQPACLRHWLSPSRSLCCANADWQLFLECRLRFFPTTTGRLKASPSVSRQIGRY